MIQHHNSPLPMEYYQAFNYHPSLHYNRGATPGSSSSFTDEYSYNSPTCSEEINNMSHN